MKKILASAALVLTIIVSPAAAFAHVVVKPAEVETASFQTFNTGVPNEKDMAVTGLRLVIPSGLQYVQPTVKPGWTIEEKTSGGGEFPTVTEISWTAGSIPAGQRDDFTFSAQAPAKATNLAWKAYQTYEDGTVVAWDQKPNGKDEEGTTPYSETKVVDELSDKKSAAATHKDDNSSDSTATVGVALGTLGVLLGAGALLTKRK